MADQVKTDSTPTTASEKSDIPVNRAFLVGVAFFIFLFLAVGAVWGLYGQEIRDEMRSHEEATSRGHARLDNYLSGQYEAPSVPKGTEISIDEAMKSQTRGEKGRPHAK